MHEELAAADTSVWTALTAVVDAHNRIGATEYAFTDRRINPAWLTAVDTRDAALARLSEAMSWRRIVVASTWREDV